MSQYNRKLFFSNIIKEAATKAEDIITLQDIFVSKYPNDRAARGLAVQYYDKFIKKSDPEITLTEDGLPQPLPPTVEELKILLRSVDTVRGKSKSEELLEELKSKHPDVDLSNLNEDYLSWLHKRYIKGEKKSGEIVHRIQDALVILRKFPSIQDKARSIPEFRKKVEDAGYLNISSIKDLTYNDIIKIISLDTTELTVRVHGVEIKDEEFLGKFGEWNLWIPHTKETSVKIAGYDEVTYEPKTDWCTNKTRDSNLFYNYIGRHDYPTFLFYIIKDNPVDENDWLSLGYVSSGDRLSPDFSGEDGGLSVNRDNEGLEESDYSKILGDQWPLIKSRIESEIERHKVIEKGKKKYVSPAKSIIERLAKNVEEFKKELKPKSNEEKKDFIGVILDANPSDEVKHTAIYNMASIDPVILLQGYKGYNELPEYTKYIEFAEKNTINKDPIYFLKNLLNKPWSGEYLNKAIDKSIETNPITFIRDFFQIDWARSHLRRAVKEAVKTHPLEFIKEFSDKRWAEPFLKEAAKEAAKKSPRFFLQEYLNKSWVEDSHLIIAAENLEKNHYDWFVLNFQKYFKTWSGKYIELMSESLSEDKPDYYLDHISGKPWAKDDNIVSASLKFIEKNPKLFIKKYKHDFWASKRRDNLTDKISKLEESVPGYEPELDRFDGEYISYYPSLLLLAKLTELNNIKILEKTKKNATFIKNELLKLSNVLSRLNFKKEALLIKKLY